MNVASMGELDMEVPDRDAFPIVAVGASAGGLAALETLFRGLAENLGAAYVVLQHLSPDFESHMTELLGRVTRMPVMQAADCTELEPDRVYVIPPKKEMILSAGRLLLTDKDPRNAPSLPIDTFLRSMAREAGGHCVAVILSGTGSDGARGVREVKAAGGYVLVQDPEDAEFDGMPRSAVATGGADVVLGAAEVPTELARVLPLMMRRQEPEHVPALVDDGVRKVLDVLEQQHEIDFSCYKMTTLARRIRRRMEFCGASDIDHYAALLTADREESKRLFYDLLIGVTEFFRDPEAYEQLDAAVRETLFSVGSSEIRVWVAGCASGEEVYSVAMLLDEARLQLGWPGRIRLFATDIQQDALKRASAGIYPVEALRDLSAERRERYFVQHGSDLRVSESLREMVIFATHNLVTDAPFTQLDLICCRNVLIYFQPPTQAKVLALFHFGLRTGGLLFLGPSETLGKLGEEFDVVSAEARIFTKRRDLRLLSHPGLTKLTVGSRRREPTALITHGDRGALDSYEALLALYMPQAFLLDDRFQLQHCFGGAERFLQVKGGRTSTALPGLLTGRIKTAVAGLLERFKQDPTTSHTVNLRRAETGDSEDYRITVLPVSLRRSSRTNVLVEIHAVASPAAGEQSLSEVDSGVVAAEYVESLERDLELARGQLQSTVEELEAANEELQAANEELIASNEELQSTNEELRSVNEELNSVNVDHQKKIGELTEVTEDLESLLHTIDVGVLFLDEEMCIRRANNRIAELLHILPQDAGRSFEHFKANLHSSEAFEAVRSVLAGGERIQQHELRSPDGRVLLLNVLPHASTEAKVKGVVLTFVDITSHRAAETEARRLSAIVRSARDAITSSSLDGTVMSWNTGAARLYGYTEAEALGQPMRMLVPEDRVSEIDDVLTEVKRGNDIPPFETIRIAKDGSLVHVLLSVAPIRSESGAVTGASMIGFDITDRKRAEERATRATEQRDSFLALLSHELRNPLMALANANEIMLRNQHSADETRRAQQIISRQINHMSRLLEDTLDASRMRHDKIELQRKVLDLRTVVEAALDATKPRADRESIALEVDMPADPVQVKADGTRLQQVVVNLIQNAINHSTSDQTVQVSVGLTGRARALIRVRDQGSGITEEALPQVFEPFFQASRRSETGMGIGLSLARSIVQAHRGEIRATSDGPGKGALFEVRLPLAVNGTDAAAEKQVAGGAGAAEKSTILLIDDDEESRESMGVLLRGSGYEVHEARDGSEGLKLIDKIVPSVVVLDVGLPDISGLEVARTVRRKFGWKQVRLVALTGFGRQTDREAAIEAGCDMHLVKPIDFQTLEKVIAYQASR
ncbi:MAG TPA: chemotaxis protein CheB [Woeseiaceae bacterium]|nr:chemotaxis protein CheB [Woeseiaceae bacterium]